MKIKQVVEEYADIELVRRKERLYLPSDVFAALAHHHTVAGISGRVKLLPHVVADSVFLPMTDCDHGVEGETGTSSFPGSALPRMLGEKLALSMVRRGAIWSKHMPAAGEMTGQVASTLDHNRHVSSGVLSGQAMVVPTKEVAIDLVATLMIYHFCHGHQIRPPYYQWFISTFLTSP